MEWLTGGGGYFDKIMKKAEKYAQGGRNDRNTGESECAFDDDPMREKIFRKVTRH